MITLFYSSLITIILNVPTRMTILEDFSTRSFCMFAFIIGGALIGTFYTKSTPVHKVASLLFLSIVTVLFWINATHFLFIYLVYILAFVGAVLMLFLSVVLMLPISTTSQTNYFFVIPTLRPEGMLVPDLGVPPVLWAIIFLFFLIFGSKVVRVIKELPLSKSVLETYNETRFHYTAWTYSEIIKKCKKHDITGKLIPIDHDWHNFFYSFCPVIELSHEKKYKLNWKFYCELSFQKKLLQFCADEAIALFPANVNNNYWYRTYGSNKKIYFPLPFFTLYHPFIKKLSTALPFLKTVDVDRLCRFLNYFYFILAKWRFIFYVRSHTPSMKTFFSPLSRLKYYILRNKTKFTIENLFFTLFTQTFLEISFQVWMVVTFVLLLVPSSYLYLLEINEFFLPLETSTETVGGLANIKELLYEHYFLLLILSTVVLLVALLGAAIMTRNKR